MDKIAVIGAGIAGLTLANQLSKFADVSVFEKSKGVGGRLATRRAMSFHFDHGAQFIKANELKFREVLLALEKQGVVEVWQPRFAEIKNAKVISEQTLSKKTPHYVGVPSINAVAKALAKPLRLNLSAQVDSLFKREGLWELFNRAGERLGAFNWVVLAIPAPQAMSLYPSLNTMIEPAKLSSMTACYSLMIGLNCSLPISFDMALVHDSCINLICVNSSKPERNKAYSLIIQADSQWSQAHVDAEPHWVKKCLIEEGSKQLRCDLSKAPHNALHLWRYAHQAKQTGESFFLDSQAQIAACGDWFIESKVESAFVSGFDLSLDLINHLKGIS